MTEVARITEEFAVLERILLLNGVLPQQGDMTSIRLLRRFREALSFSDEEHAALSLKYDGARTTWEDPGGHMKVVEVGPKMRELVVAGLKAVSDAGQLTDQHLALVDRFMPEEEEGVA